MKRIYIFGCGEQGETVYQDIKKENNEIIGFIDNNVKKQGTTIYGLKVLSIPDALQQQFDYIINATSHFEAIFNMLLNRGVTKEKIINYFDIKGDNGTLLNEIFNENNRYIHVLELVHQKQIKNLEKKLNNFINNAKYEICDKMQEIKYPQICSGEEAIEQIIKNRSSITRFGDEEFELIAGKQRFKVQKVDPELGIRLKEVLQSDVDNLLIGIANNYGSLDMYDEDGANAIREYLTEDVREYHYSLLDFDKKYYDAYVTRPYVIYRDKSDATRKFMNIKRIWENRDVVMVEGDLTRLGIGNDLFDNVKSCKRILAPNENAFCKYQEILETTLNSVTKDDLILIALGATATVLSYDLAKEGYQALDVGHIDLEYEWYLNQTGKRTTVKYKYNNEVMGGYIVSDCKEERYLSEIIHKINL